jgi:hypothetical protein
VRTCQIYVAVPYFLANDEDQDGDLYAQIASNVREHHIILPIRISLFAPTFVRLPGYPLFIAGVYALFGHGNNQALFLLEGVLDTLPACCHACLAVVVNARALPSSD